MLLRLPVALVLAALLALSPSSVPAQSFVNFESGHVRPLALSADHQHLYATNTPDNRLEIFRVEGGGLQVVSQVRVGLEPVAVAVRGSDVYVVNHLSDSVSVVDVSAPAQPFVRATLQAGDEPRDIVVGGPLGDKVFVSAAHRGQNRPGDPQLTTPGVGRADVWVFDASDLAAAPHIITLFSDTPRGLAVSPDGERVYVAAFLSGNGTTVLDSLAVTSSALENATIGDGFVAPGMLPPLSSDDGVPAPRTGLIVRFDGAAWRDEGGRDWTPRVRFDLPDKDLFVIDASQQPPVEIASVSGVGTVLFNVAVHPGGAVYVSNLESRNEVRFEPVLNGHLAENRVSIIDGEATTHVHLNPHIDYSTPSGPVEEIEQSIAFPLGMEFSADGETLYVAAFGSGKVAVLDEDAVVQERIDVGGGPSGLALDEDRERLYVMNRFDQTISIVDTVARVELEAVPLSHDPEPPEIRQGRPLLYDARNSGHGDSACATCHVFGDFDSLAWDLGDPGGAVETNPIRRVAVQGVAPLGQFHPMKGPMTTQSLRGMADAGAMHWRGDRNGGLADPFSEEKAFMAFRPAFQGLLGKETELPLPDMEAFRDFILTVAYPPNPIAPLDGSLTAEQTAGKEVFDSNGSRSGIGGDGDACADCHDLPFGTGGRGSFEGLSQDFKVAHLRNLYQKIGMFGYALPNIVDESPFTLQARPTPHLGDQVRGFGFLHSGSIPTLFNFFRIPSRQFSFPDAPGRSGDQKVRELEAFLLAFDTGLAPVVGQQVTVSPTDIAVDPSPALERFALLLGRAEAGDCDLVVSGIIGGEMRGLVHTGGGSFQSDREAEQFSQGELAGFIVDEGTSLTATAVYPGGGARIGIDRDGDGRLDRDELDAGSDPADPDSVPVNLLRGNCNGDAGVNLGDGVFLLEFLFRHGSVPACKEACESNGDGNLDVSDAVHVFRFLFASGAAPGMYPDCESSPMNCASPVCP